MCALFPLPPLPPSLPHLHCVQHAVAVHNRNKTKSQKIGHSAGVALREGGREGGRGGGREGSEG